MKKAKYCSKKVCKICVLFTVCLLGFSVLAFAESSKHQKGYTYNLEELSRKAENNIKKVNKKLEERKKEELNKERELEAKDCFEKGNMLYGQGKLEEAKKEWQKALSITKDPSMKKYVRESEKKARNEERIRIKKEKDKIIEKRRAEKEAKIQKAREEKERKRQELIAKKEAIKEEKRIAKEKERLERENKMKLKREVKNLEKKAKKLYSNKKYEEASAAFQNILNIDPKNNIAPKYLKLILEKKAQRK
jgi:tetratricopeptide (TPR) repeat protein